MPDIGWTCHACGLERPDAKIAVFTRVRPIDGSGGATFAENIRYCIDNPECEAKAQRITFLKDQPGMLAPADLTERDMEVTYPAPRRALVERIKDRWFTRS